MGYVVNPFVLLYFLDRFSLLVSGSVINSGAAAMRPPFYDSILSTSSSGTL